MLIFNLDAVFAPASRWQVEVPARLHQPGVTLGAVGSSSDFATSRIDWGSVPDWIGGVGSALAFAGFAVAFIWEVRKRRQDDEQGDRRDTAERGNGLSGGGPRAGSRPACQRASASGGTRA